MRLTNVLRRCVALVRAAARRVGHSLGLVGRSAVRVVAAAAAPRWTGLRSRLGRLALATLALGCSEGRTTGASATAAIGEPAALADTTADSAPVRWMPAPPHEAVPAATAPLTTTTAPAVPAATDASVDPDPERPLGAFLMTFYYVATEEAPPAPAVPAATAPPPSPIDDAAKASPPATAVTATAVAANDNAAPPATAAANDNAAPPATATASDNAAPPATAGVDLAAVAPPRVPLLDRNCQPLAEVSPAFAAQVRMQGTGRLRDGRLVNVAGSCRCGTDCFHILPAGIKWGRGAWGLPLTPFRMVAVDPTLIPLGTLLYIPELDGMRMPGRPPGGGFVHDGCVVAADVGGAIKGRQLDLFVAHRAYYVGLARRGSSHAWASQVEVFDGSARCTRKGTRVSRSAAGSI